MPINSALELLDDIGTNPQLRDQMYACTGAENLKDFLSDIGYRFDLEEFEEAVRLLHVKCQTLEAAQELLHRADWLRFLLSINN